MAYDGSTKSVVLFGGAASSYLNDTWTWKGRTWTEPTPSTSPQVRDDASMVYDAATGTILLFGGESTGATFLDDTWSWNGSTWTELSPPASPPGRAGASMEYDAASGQVVLFGGWNLDSSDTLGDTWTWNGSTWSEQLPSVSPPARAYASSDYDAALSDVILFGGTTSTASFNELADTWTWNGTTWSQLAPSPSPPARDGAGMTYDAHTRDTVLFGGIDVESGPTVFGDTWRFGT
jgi:hypothetical protein